MAKHSDLADSLAAAAGVCVIALFTYRKRALSHWLALGGAGLSWLASMVVFFLAITTEDLAENPLGSCHQLAADRRHLA